MTNATFQLEEFGQCQWILPSLSSLLGSQPRYPINANNSVQSLTACGVRLAKADTAAMHARHVATSYVEDWAKGQNHHSKAC